MNENTSRIINPICDAFDAAKSSNADPDIREYLAQVPEGFRQNLLVELLKIEIEYRSKAGESCDPSQFADLGDEAVYAVKRLQDGSFSRDAATRLGQPIAESSARFVGPYKLLQKIGEGGMGTVWMAEQTQPVRRRVALKLIKRGMDSKQILARFEAERQALSIMNHPNIARVLDCGATDDGLPFFAMELVKGVSIIKYCDQNQLDINQRLGLFRDVCSAIQHAHQKGIIHRDLKPSNILIALYDSHPVPKVIDFGLAKALDGQNRLTERTMFTEFGQIVGTFQYMSPEQAEMNELDVDTRTDIYSLGVILYELLTGTTPLEKSSIQQKAHLKVLEMIRDLEPPRPSSRLSQSGADAVAGISKQRKSEPARLHNLLRGELDWIVMKSLEKNRSRRYETAKDFGQDIANFLDGDVVTAKPPTLGYKLQKAFQRNKGAFTAAMTILALLAIGTIVSSWYAYKANLASSEAKRSEAAAVRNESKAVESQRLASDAEAKARASEQKAVEALQQLQKKNEDLELQAFADDQRRTIEQVELGNYFGAGGKFTTSTVKPSIDTRILNSLVEPPWSHSGGIVADSWGILDFCRSPDESQFAIVDESGQIHIVDPGNAVDQKSYGTFNWLEEARRASRHTEQEVRPDYTYTLRVDSRFQDREIHEFFRVWWLNQQQVVSVSKAGLVAVIRLDRNEVNYVHQFDYTISSAEFDGDRIVIGTSTGEVISYSISSNFEAKKNAKSQLLLKLNSTIETLCSNDSHEIFVATRDRDIFSVNTSGQELSSKKLFKTKFAPYCMAIQDKEGTEKLLIGGSSSSLAVVDPKGSEQGFYSKLNGVQRIDSICMHPTSDEVFVFDGRGYASRLDSNLRRKEQMRVQQPNVQLASFLALADKKGVVILEKNRFPGRIKIYENETLKICTGGQSGGIEFWTPKQNRLGYPELIETNLSGIRQIDFVCNSDSLVWLLFVNGDLAVFDLDSGEEIDRINAHLSSGQLLVSENLNCTATSGNDKKIRFWKYENRKIAEDDNRATIEGEFDLIGFDIDQAGKYLAATDKMSRLNLFDIRTGKSLTNVKIFDYDEDDEKQPEGLRPLTGAVAFSPDSRLIFACGGGQTNGLFECPGLEKKKALAELLGLGGTAVTFSDNGSCLIVTDTQRANRLEWNEDFSNYSWSSPFRIKQNWSPFREQSTLLRCQDQERVVCFPKSGRARVIDNRFLKMLSEFDTGISDVIDGAVNCDCDQLVAVNRFGVISRTKTLAGVNKNIVSISSQENGWRSTLLFEDSKAEVDLADDCVAVKGNTVCLLSCVSARAKDMDHIYRNDEQFGELANSSSRMLKDVLFFELTEKETHSERVNCLVPDFPSRHWGPQNARLVANPKGIVSAVFSRQKKNESNYDREVFVAQLNSNREWMSELVIPNDYEHEWTDNSGMHIEIIDVGKNGDVNDFVHFSHAGYHMLRTKRSEDGWTTVTLGRQGDQPYSLWRSNQGVFLRTTLRGRFGQTIVSDYCVDSSGISEINKQTISTRTFGFYGDRSLATSASGNTFQVRRLIVNGKIKLQLEQFKNDKWIGVGVYPEIPRQFGDHDSLIVDESNRFKILSSGIGRNSVLLVTSKDSEYEVETVWQAPDGAGLEVINIVFVLDENGNEVILAKGSIGEHGSWLREFRRSN